MLLIFTTLNYTKIKKRHAMQKNIKGNAGRYRFQLRLEVALSYSHSTRPVLSLQAVAGIIHSLSHSAINNGQETTPTRAPHLVLRQPLNISPAA